MYNIFLKERKITTNYLFISIFITFILLFPYFIDQTLFGDDNYRFIFWRSNFEGDGRFGADYLLSLFSGSTNFFLPTHPLGLILGLICLFVILSYLIKQYKLADINYIILPILLLGNPYMFQILSYKVDNFHMLISIDLFLFSAIMRIDSFLVKNCRYIVSYILFIFVKLSFVFFAFSMYQASMSVYAIATCFICFFYFLNYEDLNFNKFYLIIIENLICLIIAYLFYRFIARNDMIGIHYTEASSILVFKEPNFLKLIISNFHYYLNYLLNVWKDSFYLYCYFLLSQILLLYIVFKTKQTILNKIFISFVLLISFFLIFVHFLVLKSVPISYRLFLGFGMFLCFCFILNSYVIKNDIILIILIFPLILVFFVQTYAFYNFKSYAFQKNDNILRNIYSSLKVLQPHEKNINLNFVFNKRDRNMYLSYLLDGHPIFFSMPYFDQFVKSIFIGFQTTNRFNGMYLSETPFDNGLVSYDENFNFKYILSSKRIELDVKEIIYKRDYSILYSPVLKEYLVQFNGFQQHSLKALNSNKIISIDQIKEGFFNKYNSEFDIYVNRDFVYLKASCGNIEKWNRKGLTFTWLSSVGAKNKYYSLINFLNRDGDNCIASIPIPSVLKDRDDFRVILEKENWMLFELDMKQILSK